MATYDVHQHLWPDAFVTALRERSSPPLLRAAEIVTIEGSFPIDLSLHDPETRTRALDRDAIDVAVLSLQPSLGLDTMDAGERDELEGLWADGTLAIVSASGGRFLALSPSRVRDGFSGVALGASSLLDLDDAAPVLDEASELGLPVFVHPQAATPARAGLPEWWTWVADYPAQMQAAYLAWIGRQARALADAPRRLRAPCRWRAVPARTAGASRGRRALGTRSEHVLRRRHLRASCHRAPDRDVRRAPARLRERHAGRRPRADPCCRPGFR